MHLKSDQLTSRNVRLFHPEYLCLLGCRPADGFLCCLGVDSQSGQWVGCIIYSVYNLYGCVLSTYGLDSTFSTGCTAAGVIMWSHIYYNF